MSAVKLIECPRDAWQGLAESIPTEDKAAYLRMLIDCGFRHIDAVSFVSPKYVPQMADSEAVLALLESERSALQGADIIGIAVNGKGLERALAAPGVTTVGYPHSLSETFLQSNARQTFAQSRALVRQFLRGAQGAGRQLVVYISMAFGNPYNDPWSPERVAAEVVWLRSAGVQAISLADTVGLAGPEEVVRLLAAVFAAVDAGEGGVEIGIHLHGRAGQAAEKILAAYEAGCRRFDSALTGLGGCPFAGDELVGNLPTEIVIDALERSGARAGIARDALERALAATRELRRRHAGA